MGSEAEMGTNMAMQTSQTNEPCELHILLRRPMQLCRIVGLFPVEGLNDKDITKLRFKIKSVYAIFHVATLICQALFACFTVYYFFTNAIELESLKYLIFYWTGFVSAVLLLKLARDWPELMRKANQLENSVAGIRSCPKGCGGIVSVVMILALIEHILSNTFQTKFVMVCYDHFNIDLRLMKYYFSRTFVFQTITYSEWKAILFEMVVLQSTFIWNITDGITMCVSLYLTSYFKNLNKLIERQEKQNSINWKEIRLYYSYLVELVNAVDRRMCYLILMSFFTNLFFICVQLFHLTNYIYPVLTDCSPINVELVYTSIEHLLYYTYSFFFLFIRAFVSSLLAANVNTVAQRPLLHLQNVTSSEYTLEVQRFIRQIRYSTTALSGVCFYITRGMILTVVATIVKYELVIVQFI